MPLLTPTQKLRIRKAISAYCLHAEANQLLFHYSQQRPFHYREPNVTQYLDCSGYVSVAYWHAMHETGCFLADPLGMKMTGWGWTGSEIAWLRAHGKPAPAGKWLVGDLVLYGHSVSATVHTAICRTAGDDRTSWWSSNGNEHAPQPVRIGYHPDPIVGVYRHPALA